MRPTILAIALAASACGADAINNIQNSNTASVAVAPPPKRADRTAPLLKPVEKIEVAKPARTAISCDASGIEEIYIIDDKRKQIFFFNKGTKAIEPLCRGDCNWTSSDSQIAFENDSNGFIRGAVLDRATGKLILKFADDENPVGSRECERTAMPKVGANKF